MSQVDVDTSIGYALKRVTWALRSWMDAALRPHDLTVSQYACLELLAQRPGLSNAELARGVFVTRQATHQLLAGLRRARLIEVTGTGRDQRLTLTPDGSRRRADASRAVAAVEQTMLSGLTIADQAALRGHLATCAEALIPVEQPDGR